MKLSQKGFSAVEAILIVVIVAIVGGTGYYVYHANKSANNNLKAADQETTTTSTSASLVATITKSKLPSGYHIEQQTKTVSEVSNQGEGEPANNCFVEAVKSQAKSVKAGDSSFAATQEAATEKTANDNKGYTYESQGSAQLSVNTTKGSKTLDAFYNKVSIPGDDNSPMYQKTAYIVLNGSYITITQSCSTSDLTQADQALAAFKVNL